MNKLICLVICLLFVSTTCFADAPIENQFTIDVNKQTHTLTLLQNNEIVSQYDIIIGKSKTPTPDFETTFDTIDINPTWNLTSKEIYQMKKHPELKEKYGVIFSDEKVYSPPSGKNPLGKARLNLKYKLPIKIHGTSEPDLFKTNKHEYSSGCIRVLEIKDLVQKLTSENIDWDKIYTIRLKNSVHVVVH